MLAGEYEPTCCYRCVPPGGGDFGTLAESRRTVIQELERLNEALRESYEVERELGRGGMATVYLARDLKHDRMVAIKVLAASLAESIGAERFVREIKTTANLHHPHILPLYDSGEANGLLYYVMPFVDGESLRDTINREHQLALEVALRYAREVADALHYAHGRGIVHRDIKPANIMIADGHAIVADFGIAGAVNAAGSTGLTQTGTSVGTPTYMAPEQAMGADLDGRADQYSLACVLYEMLTGEPPFTGKTAQTVIARHALEDVPKPSIVRNSIPENLESAILCAMNKSPADRFKTVAEFRDALSLVDAATATHRLPTAATVVYRQPTQRRPVAVKAGLTGMVVVSVGLLGWIMLKDIRPASGVAGGAGEIDRNSVAVLYFDDLTSDSSLAYLADGLTEELIDQLSQVRELDVISRNGVQPYRSHAVSRDSIARVLKVGSLIEGSVEHAGDRVRVTTRLIDGASGAEFDRATFELPTTGLLVARDSVAQVAARMFRTQLGEEVRLRKRRASTNSVEAWSLLQRAERLRKDAERLLDTNDAVGAFAAFQRADSVLTLAEAADRNWVAPIILRGTVAYRESRLAGDDAEAVQLIETGLDHAARALTLEPNHAEALALRGTLRYWHWLLQLIADPSEAAALFASAKHDLERATKLDPTLAAAHSTLSHLHYQTDDVVSALLAARTAYEEDAYLSVANAVLWRLFTGHYDLEQLTQAERWCKVAHERFPEDYRFQVCQLWIMVSGSSQSDVSDAWYLQKEVARLAPENVRDFQSKFARMIVGGILGRAGLTDSARNVLVQARSGRDVDPGLELAWIEAYMRVIIGDHDEAINRLKLYLLANPVDQTPNYESNEVFWWWRPLRDHPRFDEVRAATQ